jgi:hypothetical protein
MIAIDRPNTLMVTPGYERHRLFYPFRYKQDNVNPWDGYEVLLRRFQDYRDSTFEFRHTLNDYPYMR